MENRAKTVNTEYNFKKVQIQLRKPGPVKVYSAEEIRAMNEARGLVSAK